MCFFFRVLMFRQDDEFACDGKKGKIYQDTIWLMMEDALEIL